MDIKIIDNEMPVSVNELVKSRSGREYLAKLQERHKVDIAQPGTKLFDQAWKPKVQAREARQERQRQESARQWEEHRARRVAVRKHRLDRIKGTKYYI